MARRRYRKGVSRRRRGFRRRRTRASKALARVRSLSRKIAGEVKKIDMNAIIPENSFSQLTAAIGTAADVVVSLPDYGYLFSIFTDASSATSNPSQGYALGDWIGEQIRAKYLYVGVHLQMPVRPSSTESSPTTVQQPLCIRCMVVQDRNYSPTLSLTDMVQNLFGIAPDTTGTTPTYRAMADYTLLPINPQEPGRFKVMRDFKMYVAPGYRMDYYKKIMLLQRDMLSQGRFYAGQNTGSSSNAPGDASSNWAYMRNRIYVLLLFQSPTLYGTNVGGAPDFTVSLQTRLAYYDN